MLAGVLLIAGAISVTVMSTTSVVCRQRPRPVMPPGPPWKLVSPFGVLHIIEDRDALGTFIAAEELDTFNIKHLLGLQEGSSAQPMHVKFWQPLHLLLFLGRNGSNELVPVLGGPGHGVRKGEASPPLCGSRAMAARLLRSRLLRGASVIMPRTLRLRQNIQ